ncbi:MAG: tetratricopeptide repeat protein [Lacipirellulaceae bacterium]
MPAPHAKGGKNSALEYPGAALKAGILKLADAHEKETLNKPHSLEGHVGVVDAYSMLWCFGFVPREEVLSKVLTAAETAIAIDERDARAQTAMGVAKLSAWDWLAAEQHLHAATEINPKLATAHHWYALFLAASDRHEEAIKYSRRAVSLDPSPGMQTGLGAVLYFGHDWKQQITHMESTLKNSADFAPGLDWLGMAYVQEKQYDKALTTYEKAVELSGGLAEILAGLGHAYALAGETEKAREVLAKLQLMDEKWYVPPVQIAYVLVGLGETDEAFRYLDRAFHENSWELVFLRVEPWFDPLRDDPRFKRLEKSMGFPDRN